MNAIVTGSSNGLGKAVTEALLSRGINVYGFDLLPSTLEQANYVHVLCNVGDVNSLPEITEDIHYIVNCAATTNSGLDIDINLKGTMNIISKYGLKNFKLNSIVNIGDSLSYMGLSYGEYVASKGGLTDYTKWVAKQIARRGATCNVLSFGGIYTSSNDHIMASEGKRDAVRALTPLRKWVDLDEASKWVLFFLTVNKSCSGQTIVIDNLESLNGTYVI